ncbi:MAG TPA: flavin reductase family protein [Trebonia sp.]|jgi:flavin reductase (DIM6/NTAB) family NADH-FMN oxidoreductase RutF
MSLTSAETGPASFKAALGSLAASVNVITLWDAGGRPLGMTATAFSSVSVDPLLVLVCINRATRTYDQVSAGERFGVNILGTDAREISDYCGRPGGDKVLEAGWLAGGGAGTGADVGVGDGAWNSPALSGALAFLDCRVDQEVQAGTHAVIIGAVEGIGLAEPPGPGPHSQPLLHFRGRYRQLDRVRQAAAPRPLPIALEELA